MKYTTPDLLTPNRFEALELAGLSRDNCDPFPQEEVVSKIFERFAPKLLAVTLGAEGMLLAENGTINKVIPTFAKEVFDDSGAGDTVIAALTLGLIGEQNFVHGKAEFVFMDGRSGFGVQDEVLLERIHDSVLSLAARLRKKNTHFESTIYSIGSFDSI